MSPVRPERANAGWFSFVPPVESSYRHSDPAPSGTVFDLSYGFNAGNGDNGDVVSISSSGAQAYSRSYSYDALNRLKTMDGSGGACTGLNWDYDAWGNRTSQAVTAGACPTWSAGYDVNNRIITPAGYQYDPAGNLVNDTVHNYTYDAENRILQVDGGSTASYVYAVDGDRVEKVAGGVTTEYFSGVSGQVLAELAPGGTASADYIYAGSRLVKHARHYWLLLAEAHLTRRLFASMVRRIELLPLPTG